MNIICSAAEALTATTQLIGTMIGSLSIIWSHLGGIFGPSLVGVFSTICASAGDLTTIGSNFLPQALGCVGGTVTDLVSMIVPK